MLFHVSEEAGFRGHRDNPGIGLLYTNIVTWGGRPASPGTAGGGRPGRRKSNGPLIDGPPRRPPPYVSPHRAAQRASVSIRPTTACAKRSARPVVSPNLAAPQWDH